MFVDTVDKNAKMLLAYSKLRDNVWPIDDNTDNIAIDNKALCTHCRPMMTEFNCLSFQATISIIKMQ